MRSWSLHHQRMRTSSATPRACSQCVPIATEPSSPPTSHLMRIHRASPRGKTWPPCGRPRAGQTWRSKQGSKRPGFIAEQGIGPGPVRSKSEPGVLQLDQCIAPHIKSALLLVLIQLDVNKKPIPETLEEVEDHAFRAIQKAKAQHVAIEPVQKCTDEQRRPSIRRLSKPPF